MPLPKSFEYSANTLMQPFYETDAGFNCSSGSSDTTNMSLSTGLTPAEADCYERNKVYQHLRAAPICATDRVTDVSTHIDPWGRVTCAFTICRDPNRPQTDDRPMAFGLKHGQSTHHPGWGSFQHVVNPQPSIPQVLAQPAVSQKASSQPPAAPLATKLAEINPWAWSAMNDPAEWTEDGLYSDCMARIKERDRHRGWNDNALDDWLDENMGAVQDKIWNSAIGVNHRNPNEDRHPFVTTHPFAERHKTVLLPAQAPPPRSDPFIVDPQASYNERKKHDRFMERHESVMLSAKRLWTIAYIKRHGDVVPLTSWLTKNH